MPGAGGTLAVFHRLQRGKRWSKEPEKFGKGSEEGVAAPRDREQHRGQHGADSASELRDSRLEFRRRAAGRASDPRARAGAAAVRGEPRGRDRPLCRLFHCRHRQILVGAIILPVCIWLVNRPQALSLGLHLALVMSGMYTVHMSLFDLGIVMAAGLLGYFMRYFGFPVLPAVLGVVLGELVEANYRRSLVVVGRRLLDLPRRPDLRSSFFVLAIAHRDGLARQRMARAANGAEGDCTA